MRVDVFGVKRELDALLNSPCIEIPPTVVDLLLDSQAAIEQLCERIASERGRANLLQEELDKIEKIILLSGTVDVSELDDGK